MSKKIFQDVVKIKTEKKIERPEKKASYSDIKLNTRKDTQLPVVEKINKINTKKRKIISPNMLWFVALIAVVFLFFAISSLFSSAVVNIVPKTKDFNLDKTLTAVKDVNVGALSYDLVVISGEESKELKSGEEKDYLEYAKGKVLVYNSFSSSPQIFSKDTRLEGSNGKIYKTKSQVIVPGMKKDMLGKIDVEIYGSEVGETYNSSPLDFKIYGFRGTSKYTKFYARSVGDITGGLKGKSRQVSQFDKENAIKELKENLSNKLFQKAKDQIPKNFVLLKDAMYLNVDDESETPADNNGNVVVRLKGTFNGIIFNKENLEKEILTASLSKDDNTDAYVSNMESLIFSKPDKELITLNDMKDITFNLSGNPKIVWRVDDNKIKEELFGKNKDDFNQVLAGYIKIIDSANLKVKPVWQKSLPLNSKKIKIIVNYPL
jgi:hypothetical protein